MKHPKVKKSEWIAIGKPSSFNNIHGYILDIYSNEYLVVGYCQNGSKAIKSDVIWCGDHWDFKHDFPNGSYLHGVEESIVKRGRYRKT